MTDNTAAQAEPWRWDEPVWRGHAEHVRAGRPLRPVGWPGGARVAVAISFDADHETLALRDGETSPAAMAVGEYGSRVAVPRILALLKRHQVPATFFVPAVSALLHPADIRQYAGEGHEVGAHGWIHERNALLTEADERDLALRSLDALEKLSGTRPVGIRTPSWDFSAHTLNVIRDAGLRYDSSLMADDEPYELVSDGTPTGVTEIPVEWIRDDAVYFAMERYAGLRPHTAPTTVFDIWSREFRGSLAEGGVFQLTMHPHVIGHRSRLWILDDLLHLIRGSGPVWFATHAKLADYVMAEAARP